ncbi:WxcM-like domain-containing protein [Nitrosarchaeum sp.]|uniref:WxcM-like domain-containing protein n=1 Tax=Nitrosarchaeum sp. TaxID=2026886 RepID=UPI00247DFD32|nr:WxcM-like domain-containing protein [Nitrosarchaeum sp.]MCV0411909.1 FdtA/QdtA family cupin domain-containing protein [Nitrosarchaeum sp.]
MIEIKNLEVHETKNIHTSKANGNLTVVYRDWDNYLKIPPAMIYITSVHPNEIKGPHLHKKRNSYFLCIDGKVLFVIKDRNGKYEEIITDSNKPQLIFVPKETPSAHLNLSKDNSSILVLADLAWRPNDNEMDNIEFSDYDWSKWKNK